jgi:tetratricopeptide (TPR) repeat protein
VIGKTISHYRIVAKIGAGGMGEVYRAHDPRLDREVAIKTLSRTAIADPVRLGRFEREARATGALNHPNILAIYDVGQHGGVPFIVSELLRGSTLRDRLRAGDVTTRRALEYAIQVADGLAAAHARGIIHRDLKPENVFITDDGVVKILDFGLAKLHHPDRPSGDPSGADTPTVETEDGAIVGTLGYMSPEQLHGKPADHRSDIFAFGALLYEMLAGTRAFSGDSKANVVAAILRDDPPAFASFQRPVPQPLEQLVRRCLEKRPEDRYQSAHDLALALRAIEDTADWSTTNLPLPRPWRRRRFAAVALVVAVLAAVSAAIWAWRQLAIGSGSGGAADLPEPRRVILVCADAGAGETPEDAVMACGVSAWLARAMILIEAQTGGDVWAVSEVAVAESDMIRKGREMGATIATRPWIGAGEQDGDLNLDVVALPSRVLVRSAVVRIGDVGVCGLLRRAGSEHETLLGVELDDAAARKIDALIPKDEPACRRFVDGLGLLAAAGDRDPGGAQSVLALEGAVAADSTFAPAELALARACRRRHQATGEASWLERGLAAARKATDLDARGADGWLELAELHTIAGKLEESIIDLERAAELEPARADVQKALAIGYRRMQRLGDAERALQRAIRMRPGDGSLHSELGYLYYLQGQRDAAINQFRRSIDCTPDNYLAYSNVGAIFLEFGMEDEAREMFERSLALEPNYEAYSNLAYLAFSKSNFGEAVERYEKALALGKGDYVTWGNLGVAYHHMDQHEEARRCLARAVELGDEDLAADPNDANLMVDLATYHALLGDRSQALELLARATRSGVDDPVLMALVGEAYEDAGQRQQALAWLERAFQAGLEPSWIDNSPTLRRVEEVRALARHYGG